MKKTRDQLFLMLQKEKKWIRVMKITTLLLLIGFFQIHATVLSQGNTISISEKNISLEELLWKIQEETDFVFVFSQKHVKDFEQLDVNVEGELDKVLTQILSDKGLTYEKKHDVYVIKKAPFKPVIPQQPKKITITGSVKDEDGEVIPGVNVYTKDSSSGTITDAKGNFKLLVYEGTKSLIVSFIGMKTMEVEYKGEDFLEITMQSSIQDLDEVVISGQGFTWNKKTFTGAATKVTAEDIIRINPVNIFNVLETIDPSFKVIESNEFGSDPNRQPEIIVRGNNSVPDLDDVRVGDEFIGNPNMPLFMVNGFEQNLRFVMDLPPEQIESMTLLKDASATAIYGANAANGIVVIELKQPKTGELRVSYGINTSIKMPDLSSYDLLNAEEKLEMELIRGSETRYSDSYNRKQRAIAQGVDTDWLDAPTRTGYSYSHNLNMSGGAGNFTFGTSLNTNPDIGVIRGSERKRYSGTTNVNYNSEKLTVANSLSYSETHSANSMYGSFSDYVKLNPYYYPYTEDGEFKYQLSNDPNRRYDVPNPLWNTNIGAFDEQVVKNLSESIRFRWRAIKRFNVNGTISYSTSTTNDEKYLPAIHSKFVNENDPTLKGTNEKRNVTSDRFTARLGASYLFLINKHSINTNIGANYAEVNGQAESYSTRGFPSQQLSGPNNAVGYNTASRPYGASTFSRTAGYVAAVSYAYDYKYFMDFSYRGDIASQFGENNRWANFWSAGIGYNLDKEEFIQNLGFINTFRIKGSMGNTGSTRFNAYQALQIYEYSRLYYNDYAPGVILKGHGNPNLKWQSTIKKNIGINTSFFEGLLSVNVDYYREDSEDAILPQSLPVYLGYNSYSVNSGGIKNEGLDFQLASNIRIGKDLSLSISLNGNTNREEVVDIGDAYKNQNENVLNNMDATPVQLVQEGKATSLRYVRKSLGIDPATGQEVFETEDGNKTFVYEEGALVSFNQDNDIRGGIGLNIIYKNLMVNCNFQYGLGGENFNSTLLGKVENIGTATNNLDRRVYTDRWTKPGDISLYKNIKDIEPTKASSRFLQDASFLELNSLSISYAVNPKWIQKTIGLKNLSISTGFANLFRLSPIRVERGTAYPFARSYTLSVRTNF